MGVSVCCLCIRPEEFSTVSLYKPIENCFFVFYNLVGLMDANLIVFQIWCLGGPSLMQTSLKFRY